MPKISQIAPTSETFEEYNRGKLEVVDGLVHLLPAGWAEYGPAFSAADLMLRDKFPLVEFKAGVRTAARAAIVSNDAALTAELQKLDTSLEDKRFIRKILDKGTAAQEIGRATAKVLAFPTKG